MMLGTRQVLLRRLLRNLPSVTGCAQKHRGVQLLRQSILRQSIPLVENQTRFYSSDDEEFDGANEYFQSASAPKTMSGPSKVLNEGRIWMGSDVPLSEKINLFLDTPPGDLHRRDIHLSATDLIKECCQQRSLNGLQQANDILNRLLLEKRSSPGLMVSTEPFEELIFGWARFADKSAPNKMIDILRLMETEYDYDMENGFQDGDENMSRTSCQPTVATYNSIFRGLAQVAKHDASAAFLAEDGLNEMIKNCEEKGWNSKPNTRTWTHVIQAHGNSGSYGAADRVERLLKRMVEMHEVERARYEAKHGRPYDMMDPSQNVHQIVTPDERVYSTVLSAIANSKAKFSAERAQDLLAQWLEQGIMVDAFAFNAVVIGFARLASALPSPLQRFQAACKAEELAHQFFQQYDQFCVVDKGLTPEEEEEYWTKQLTISFNAALGGWARSDVKEAAPRAEALFQFMIETPGLRPDKISMNATLQAWARSFNAEKAEEILQFMSSLYDGGELPLDSKPDVQSYCTVMSAWAKSNAPDKTAQARRLLEIMITRYEEGDVSMKPNLVAVTTILNAAGHTTAELCAGSDPAVMEEAYQLATQAYDEIMNDSLGLNLVADSVVFAAMIKVIGVHTDKMSVERRHMLERIFDEACAAGAVSQYVIKELRIATPDVDLLGRLFRSEKLAKFLPNIHAFPPEWTKNVPRHPRFVDVDQKGTSKKRPNKR